MHILLANKGHASFFELHEKNTKPTLIRTFSNDNMMKKESSLFTDRAGTGSNSNTSNQVPFGESHFKEELASKFARDIIIFLTDKTSHQEVKSLTLICAPSFLGEIRKKITPNLRHIIKEEISKNFYTDKPHILNTYIEDHQLAYYD